MTIDEHTRPDFVATPVGTDAANPYLLGIYAPIHQEIDARDLDVIGEIPRDLNGVYLRNGPNRRYEAPGRYHWFDGDGMIHALHFENEPLATRIAGFAPKHSKQSLPLTDRYGPEW